MKKRVKSIREGRTRRSTNVVAKVVLIVRETDIDGYICQATSRKRDRESCSQRSQNTENESKSRSWTCQCRKEQTDEAMKMIPQERVSKRIVKQIFDKSVPEQNFKDSQDRIQQLHDLLEQAVES